MAFSSDVDGDLVEVYMYVVWNATHTLWQQRNIFTHT